ncbi:hypothetical protein [Sphingobacterium sp.]|uniref:hypothetical protein n=1 Tax=Sphingobacterium sp. TaxID=341027 RepID=UPI0031D9DB1A
MISKKIIKRSLVGVGSALTLTVAISFAVNAMENAHEIKNKQVEYEDWYFTGTTPEQALDPNYYSSSPLPSKPCGTVVKEISCHIVAPDSSGYPQMSANSAAGNPINSEISSANSSLTPNSTVQSFRQK